LKQTLTPGDFADRAEEFMKGNFTTLYQAFKYVKDGVAYRLGLTKVIGSKIKTMNGDNTIVLSAER
jgi:hypothetical protein